MPITFPRELPDVGYVTADVVLRDGVTASPAASGLVNYTQVAPPVWEASLTTRPLVMSEFATLEAWWLSLRGGLRSVLFRHPHVCYPRAHWGNHRPARTPGRLASVSSGNALSIISVDPALILSPGDRIGLEHANRWYVGRVTEASGSGTTRVISVEPPPPSNIAQAGAVVRFDRPGLLMRPVPDSYQATRSGRHYSVSFRLVEVAGVGSVPRDMDFNFTSPLVAAPYFTRASSATYFGADGLLKTAAINEPRIDHDPVTWEPLGLLIEEPRTNIYLNAIATGPASYLTKIGTALAVDEPSVAGPSGGAGGVIRVSGATNFSNRVERYFGSVAASASEAWSASVFVRAVTGTVTATLTATDGGSPNTGETTVAAIGEQWVRLTASQPGVAGTSNNRLWRAYGFSGDVYLWGMQLEAGSTATSHITTATAQATRAADVASIPVQDFLSEAEGTILAEFNRENLIGGYLLSISRNPPPAGQWGPRHQASFANLLSRVDYQAVADDSVGSGIVDTPVTLGKNKVALRYSGVEYSAASNGALPRVRQTAANPPTGLGLLRLGQNATGGVSLNGHIKRVSYFPRRLSDAELQEITT